jgi:hypothetical protein
MLLSSVSSHVYYCGVFNHVRQIEIHTAESLVPDSRPFEVKITVAKLNKCKSSGSDQIPSQLVQAGGETLWSEIYELIDSIWNKEELDDQWKESVIIRILNKDDKIDSSNYRGITLLSTSYETLSNILLSRLSPYTHEIIGDYQCGFRRDRSTNKISCIRHILGRKWEYSDSISDFKKTSDSVRRELCV